MTESGTKAAKLIGGIAVELFQQGDILVIENGRVRRATGAEATILYPPGPNDPKWPE